MGSRARSASPGSASSLEDRRSRKEKRRQRSRDRQDRDGKARERSRSRDKHRSSHDHRRRRSRDQERDRDRHRDRPRIKNEREIKTERRSEEPPRRDRVKQEPNASPPRARGDRQTSKEQRAKNDQKDSEEPKQGPNFETSGKLLEDTNVFNGVVIKYSEPPEAKKPKKRWRWYVFKGEESLPVLHLHRQSAYLLGKDRKIVDIPIDHPSCSRQHAVLQYRLITREGLKKVLPYIIDLGSSNGTYLNNNRIDPQRYYELREKDVLKFGYSSREYVLLHDQSKEENAAEEASD